MLALASTLSTQAENGQRLRVMQDTRELLEIMAGL